MIANSNSSSTNVHQLAIRARIPNIKESRVFYKHRIVSPYEVLAWIPRTTDLTTRYHGILDKLVRADLESTLQTREKERKWSYPYQLLELISRSKFNAIDPDLTTNIYNQLQSELGQQWKSMHKKRLLQTLEQLYKDDYIYDRYIPANIEYPEGFNTPVLSERGMAYFKQLHAQQMSLQEKHELQRTKKLRAQSLAQELHDSSAAALNMSHSNSDEVRRFAQKYCVEDMLLALYQLAKFEKTPHVRVICAFFTRYVNCPEQWKMLSVNQQVDIVRHAYEINTHMTRMILNNGMYSLRLNTPIIPMLQAMEDTGEVILDPDREQVYFMLHGMVECVENKFMPISISDVYSSSYAAASFTTSAATATSSGGARGGNRQGTRGHSFVNGNKVAAPEWNYQNNQAVGAARNSSSRSVPNRPGLSHRIGSGPAIRRKGKRQRVEYSDEDEELSEDEDLVIDRRGGGGDNDDDEEDEDEQGEEDADLMSVADDDEDNDEDGDEGSEDMDLVEDKPEQTSNQRQNPKKNKRQQQRYEAKPAIVGSSAHHALIDQSMDVDEEDEDLQSLASA